ncbi:nuclear transport factor 2 family protein [Aliiroseovarius sp.]|uniref:ester cyclase n=1 Tax=Aliiroseovarius sp. TaxID=1872442 RepID=UPI002609BBF1|nr:nuclear transport factor 2 family protein [Aliiroseovarius sp.]
MTPLNTLKAWYDRIWLQGDLDAIDELFTPDTEAQGMMEFAVGPEDFKALVPAFLAQVELEKVSYDKVLELGDWVWAHMSAHATSRASEAPITVTGQIMVRVQDGRIVEAYNQFDFLTLFEKLGYLPPETLALCLSGEGIGLD